MKQKSTKRTKKQGKELACQRMGNDALKLTERFREI